jgi:membrane fusion protein, multidrug efflux system
VRTMHHPRSLTVTLAVALLFIAPAAFGQTNVETVKVSARQADRQVNLPGELQAYLAVPIFSKVSGFVKQVNVDRGSQVRQGDLLLAMEAPEMQAQIVEAQSKAQALELQRTEAEAKLASARSTFERLKAASATPGAVAENDVVIAEKNVEAAQALVQSYMNSLKAAEAQVQAVRDLERYLQIKAPFAGVIVERNVHPGALVGPGANATPLLRLHQVSRLRLIVAVPEALVGAMVKGASVPFKVPAYPGETFTAPVARISHELDAKTRSMSVELDVSNAGLRLSPGMYPEVQWPVRRPQPSLLVPPTAIVTTTERVFVIRVTNGAAEWVNVARGARIGDLVEVFGSLRDGDTIVRRGSDEIREGTRISPQAAKPQ